MTDHPGSRWRLHGASGRLTAEFLSGGESVPVGNVEPNESLLIGSLAQRRVSASVDASGDGLDIAAFRSEAVRPG